MSRKKRVLKRPTILVDKTFGSLLVSRLINRIMWDGKKTIATNIVTTALKNSAEELSVDPLELLDLVIKNVQPIVEVKSMRIGGASYQVPVEQLEPQDLLLLGL
jgi:small subunit ribosomal protein S7